MGVFLCFVLETCMPLALIFISYFLFLYDLILETCMFFAIHILLFLFHCYSATLNIAVKTIGINQAVKLDKKLLRPILLVFHI